MRLLKAMSASCSRSKGRTECRCVALHVAADLVARILRGRWFQSVSLNLRDRARKHDCLLLIHCLAGRKREIINLVRCGKREQACEQLADALAVVRARLSGGCARGRGCSCLLFGADERLAQHDQVFCLSCTHEVLMNAQRLARCELTCPDCRDCIHAPYQAGHLPCMRAAGT